MLKKIFSIQFCFLIVLAISYCGEKKHESGVINKEQKDKRIIYIWHKIKGSACFLLQGKRNCWYAKTVKLTENLYSVRIQPDPFIDTPMLKFTFKNLKTGTKQAPKNDVTFIQNPGKLFTNYDSISMKIAKIKKLEPNVIYGEFDFRIRNQKGKWIYFTQGYFKTDIPDY